MLKTGFEIYVEPNQRGRNVNFYLFDCMPSGDDKIATNITFEPYEPGANYTPSFGLPLERAQSLMDGLWKCGLRPTEGRQSEGVTAAQARHLEDMRQVAFAKLNIEKPA